MSFFIYKNNQQYGPYSIEQLKAWVSTGQVETTDLACYEGATTWAPLSTLIVTTQVQPAAFVNYPPSWGWGWIVVGFIGFFLGALLCVTVIGAIIGIPMVVIGFPMAIYGCIKMYKRQMWNMTESVRLGVVRGMPSQAYLPQQSSQAPAPSTSPTAISRFCPSCATALDEDAKFCPSCGQLIQN